MMYDLAQRAGVKAEAARRKLKNVEVNALLHWRGVNCGGPVLCDGMLPAFVTEGKVRIGAGFSLRCTIARTELGAFRDGELVIGDGVFINQGTTIVASTRIEIGDDVRIGDFVAIYDTDYHAVDQATPRRYAPVVIERNAWISRGAVILPGVTVGAHSVIATGAIVTSSVPARTLVAGNPGRVVRQLDIDDDRWRRP